jgi:hypothetical protein
MCLKHPFVTNARVAFPITTLKILDNLGTVVKKIYSSEMINIAYTMLQPRMGNRFENKVVCWNGKALYISERKRAGGAQYATDAQLFEFAEHAIDTLHIKCPYAILDGLVRVDIFENQNNRLLVNEFESLEAMFLGSQQVAALEGTIRENMSIYWYDRITGYVAKCCDNANISNYNN